METLGKTWTIKRNKSEGNAEDKFIEVPLNIIDCSEEEPTYWLAKFVLEVRKKGKEQRYCGNILHRLGCGLQRYVRKHGRPELSLFSNPKVFCRQFGF